MESTHCFMLLHHMHSELLLVHSLQVALMAHGVRHCLALWLAEGTTISTSSALQVSFSVNVFGLSVSLSVGVRDPLAELCWIMIIYTQCCYIEKAENN